MDKETLGKVVLITGASGGIGAAPARALVGAGARVVLSARSADKLKALQKEFGADRALVVAGGVTRRTGPADLAGRSRILGPAARTE